ncbi:MAG: putative addiction module antidote protein [Propionibacteriaceae bacterium]|nr:putative addiction module antidote protein [Propionibacteriaceae bacterium]
MTRVQDLPVFNAAEYLDTEDAIAAYLEAVAEEDIAMLPAALGTVARARGMSALARDTGLARESLYRALSEDGNPTLSTLIKVLSAYGVEIALKPVRELVNS